MKYRDLLRAKVQEFESSVASFRAALVHSGQKGSILEHMLRSYLRSLLPGRLGITEGVIYSSAGEVSQQCDIIVFDEHRTPMLFNEYGTRAIPIECVFAIIEVKTSLGKADLTSFCDQLKNLRSFDRSALKVTTKDTKVFDLSDPPLNQFPILGYLVAVESSATLESLQSIPKELLSKDDFASLPNVVCVMDRGCLAYNGPGKPDLSLPPGWISYPNALSRTARYEDADAFLLFVGLLLDLLLFAEMYHEMNFLHYFRDERFNPVF